MMPAFRFSHVFLLLVSALSFNLLAQTPAKEASATIAGVVTLNGEPVRNVVVTVQPMNVYGPGQPVPPRAKTDANGRFRITGVAAGQYVIGALASTFVTAKSEQLNRTNFGIQGKTINVADGETIENLELTLRRGCVITGRVTDANGEPLVETQVQLSQINDKGQSSPWRPPMATMMYQTDDRGVYRIYGLPAGKYKVSVGLSVRTGYFSMRTARSYIPETFHPDTTDEAQAKIIELEDGQEASGVDIRAAEALKAFEISGRVVDAATGQPVAGIGLAFSSIGPNGQMMGFMTGGWRTDPNGEFQIPGARPGKHAVFIEDRENKNDLYSEPTAVEVVNEDVDGIVVRAQHGVSISGMVVLEGSNDPAMLARRSLMTVEASSSSGASGAIYAGTRRGKVNSDGSFRISGLAPGKVRLLGYAQLPKVSLLRVERAGAPLKTRDFEIRPGEQVNDLRIVFGYGDGTLRGQVKIVGAELPEGFQFSVSLARPGSEIFSSPRVPLDERGHFIFKDLVPGQYEVRLSHSFSGNVTNDMVTKLFPRLAATKQIVTVTNGSEAQTTLTVDLSQEN